MSPQIEQLFTERADDIAETQRRLTVVQSNPALHLAELSRPWVEEVMAFTEGETDDCNIVIPFQLAPFGSKQISDIGPYDIHRVFARMAGLPAINLHQPMTSETARIELNEERFLLRIIGAYAAHENHAYAGRVHSVRYSGLTASGPILKDIAQG